MKWLTVIRIQGRDRVQGRHMSAMTVHSQLWQMTKLVGVEFVWRGTVQPVGR